MVKMSISNKDALNFFKNLSVEQPSKAATKLNAANDMSHIDAEFLDRFLREHDKLLDLASGGGLMLDKLSTNLDLITAVEPFEEFSRHIAARPNLEVVNQTLQTFTPQRLYDVISMFGIMNFFSSEEAGGIYKKYHNYLLPGGMIVIKNQFGVSDDVTVDGYSREIGKNYYSQYRSLKHEKEILSKAGFEKIEHYDIYPPECNHWSNTHYYALTAYKI